MYHHEYHRVNMLYNLVVLLVFILLSMLHKHFSSGTVLFKYNTLLEQYFSKT